MKKSVVILVAIALFLAVVGAIIVGFSNNKIEDEMTNVVNKKINESGLNDNLEFESISVSASNGSVKLTGVEYSDDEIELNVGSIEARVPVQEALSFVTGSDKAALTNIEINIKDLKMIDKIENIKIVEDTLNLVLKGQLTMNALTSNGVIDEKDLVINLLDMNNKGLEIKTKAGVMSVNDLAITLDCNINYNNMVTDDKLNTYKDLAEIINNAKIDIEGFTFNADEEVKQSLAMMVYMFLGNSSFVSDDENWSINNLTVDTVLDNSIIEVKNVYLLTKWIDLTGNGSITIDDINETFAPLNLKLNMNNYSQDLKPLFIMLASEMAGVSLPENKFSLSISLQDEYSIPNVVIEEF